jgi:hypothetical protein
MIRPRHCHPWFLVPSHSMIFFCCLLLVYLLLGHYPFPSSATPPSLDIRILSEHDWCTLAAAGATRLAAMVAESTAVPPVREVQGDCSRVDRTKFRQSSVPIPPLRTNPTPLPPFFFPVLIS